MDRWTDGRTDRHLLTAGVSTFKLSLLVIIKQLNKKSFQATGETLSSMNEAAVTATQLLFSAQDQHFVIFLAKF